MNNRKSQVTYPHIMEAVLQIGGSEVKLQTLSDFFWFDRQPSSSVSFLKKLADRITYKGLEKSKETLAATDIIIKYLEQGNVQLDPQKGESLINEGNRIIDFAENFLSIFDEYEIDDSITLEIINNSKEIKRKLEVIVELTAMNVAKIQGETMATHCQSLSTDTFSEIWSDPKNDHWDNFLRTA